MAKAINNAAMVALVLGFAAYIARGLGYI